MDCRDVPLLKGQQADDSQIYDVNLIFSFFCLPLSQSSIALIVSPTASRHFRNFLAQWHWSLFSHSLMASDDFSSNLILSESGSPFYAKIRCWTANSFIPLPNC
jgi:hypothetical protein